MTDEIGELGAWLRSKVWDPKASIQERRAIFADLCSDSLPLPDDASIEVCTVGGVPGEWVSIRGQQTKGTLIYLHGGGYSFGSPETHREFAARLARAGACRVFTVDYRLAPEHPFPAAVEDAKNAYLGLLSEGQSPSEIFVAGDSAGGGLAVSLLLALREEGAPLPGGACLISAWLDLTLTGPSMDTNAEFDSLVRRGSIVESARRYLGPDVDTATPLASSIFADLRGLPPILVHVGLRETLLSDSIRFVEKACTDGVDITLRAYPHMTHMFPFFAKRLAAGRRAVDEIGEFIKRRAAGE